MIELSFFIMIIRWAGYGLKPQRSIRMVQLLTQWILWANTFFCVCVDKTHLLWIHLNCCHSKCCASSPKLYLLVTLESSTEVLYQYHTYEDLLLWCFMVSLVLTITWVYSAIMYNGAGKYCNVIFYSHPQIMLVLYLLWKRIILSPLGKKGDSCLCHCYVNLYSTINMPAFVWFSTPVLFFLFVIGPWQLSPLRMT